jgi:AraC-like DNA-binding protein
MRVPSGNEEPVAAVELSSDALPRHERFPRWREELMARVLRVDVDVPDRGSFRTRVQVVKLPRLSVIERRSTPSLVKRDRVLIRDGADDLVFNFAWEGVSHWRGADSDARIAPGQAIVSSLAEVCGFHSPEDGAGAAIRIGRARALRTLPAIERRLMQPVGVSQAAVTILRSYLDTLRRGPALSASTALLADHQIEELVAHIFDPAGDLARGGPNGGVKAARLNAAFACVAARLTSPHLNAASVARRIGVSERYLQRLMEEQGTSLSAHIREERLQLARRLLQDPRRAHRRISEIAGEAGFNDLSYFNRMFLRRFGMTPREARGSDQRA